MLQLQQLMGSGAATPSSHLSNNDSLQRMVEQEEHELRTLQMQLHQQQQQLSLRNHLAGFDGGGGGFGLGRVAFGGGGANASLQIQQAQQQQHLQQQQLQQQLQQQAQHQLQQQAQQQLQQQAQQQLQQQAQQRLQLQQQQLQQLRPAIVGISTTPAVAAETTKHVNTSTIPSLIPAPKAKGPMKKRLKHAHDLSLAQEAAAAGTGGSKTMVTAQPKMAGAPMYQYTTTLPPPPVPPPGYFPAGQPKQRLLLYSPEDHHWLSDQLCFVRKLIEIFEANNEDVTARSRRGGMKKPIKTGRVGLRCVFCSNVPARQRAKGAVSYPNSIRIVHQAIRNFQRYHLMQCPNMPQSIKDEYKSLKTTRCHSGNASLQYWVTSCHALGMCDTDPDNGIRLRAPPSGDVVQALVQQKQSAPSTGGSAIVSAAPTRGVAATVSSGSAGTGSSLAAQISGPSTTPSQGPPPPTSMLCQKVTNESTGTQGPSLVLGTRLSLILGTPPEANSPKDHMDSGGISSGDLQTTPYMSLILAQQRPTFYQPADSLGKRRPRPSGFPGMECKHCSSPSRVASPGRYFPLTTTVLANNNNPGGCVYVHLMKCGRCPQDVKIKLQRLAERHTLDGENLERGWRRKLFSALWERLHKGRVWDEGDLAQAHASDETQGAEESMEDGQKGRPVKEGGDDVGTAALALSALSGLAGKRKMHPDEDDADT